MPARNLVAYNTLVSILFDCANFVVTVVSKKYGAKLFYCMSDHVIFILIEILIYNEAKGNCKAPTLPPSTGRIVPVTQDPARLHK